ncbi:hypothetical protein KM043_000943 [Ampulex compressa]|nr:hypothetical protein KM043_000943 [Ampulex compressa]
MDRQGLELALDRSFAAAQSPLAHHRPHPIIGTPRNPATGRSRQTHCPPTVSESFDRRDSQRELPPPVRARFQARRVCPHLPSEKNGDGGISFSRGRRGRCPSWLTGGTFGRSYRGSRRRPRDLERTFASSLGIFPARVAGVLGQETGVYQPPWPVFFKTPSIEHPRRTLNGSSPT